MSTFRQTALQFKSMGFRVIPGKPATKTPYISWKKYQTEPVTVREINDWADLWPDATPLLLTGVSDHEDMALYVIDVDDMSLLPWVQYMLGDSPLKVSTGREGGGVHLYFQGEPDLIRCKVGQVGPDDAFEKVSDSHIKSSIDIKGAGGYVVAPGALHKSGRQYLPQGLSLELLTSDFMWALPYFPELEVEEALEGFEALKASLRKAGDFDFKSIGNWTDDTSVVLKDGSRVSLKDAAEVVSNNSYKECWCPGCGLGRQERGRTEPAAKIYNNEGVITVYCFSEQKLYLPKKPELDVVSETLGCPTFFDLPLIDTENVGQLVSGEKLWVPEIPADKSTIIINYPMGHGKTFSTALYMKSQIKGTFVGPTEALTTKMAVDFDSACYKDAPGQLADAKLAICIPSLRRAGLGVDGWMRDGVLFIDEPEQLFDMMHEKTIMRDPVTGELNTAPVWEHLSGLAQLAKTRIFCDAFASARLPREIKRLLKDPDAEIHWISPPADYKPLQGFTEYRYESRSDLLKEVLGCAERKERMTIACDTKKAALALERLVGGAEGYEVLCVHGESSSEVKAKIKNATAECGKYDCIIYTQAMGSGVSLEMEGYKSFLHGTAHMGSSGDQLRQMHGRLRAPLDNERHSWVSNRKYDLEIDLAVITAQEKARAAMIEGSVSHHLKDGILVSTLKEELVIESRADAIWHKNITSCHSRKWYYDSLIREGCHVVDVESTGDHDLDELFDAACEDLSNERIAALRGALALTKEQAEELSGTDDKAEQVMLQRYHKLEEWGSYGLEGKFLKDDGKLTDARMLMTYVIMLEMGQSEVLEKITLAKAVSDKTFHKSHLDDLILQAKVARQLLRLLGWTSDQITNLDNLEDFVLEDVLDDELLKNVQSVDDIYKIKTLFNLTVPTEVDKLRGFFTRLFKKLGLTRKHKKVTIDGERKNVSVIDLDDAKEWRAAINRGIKKILREEVELVTDLDKNERWEGRKYEDNILSSLFMQKQEESIKTMEKLPCPF